VNLEEIAIDDNGEINPESVKKTVESFLAKYPELIETKSRPGHDGRAPGSGSSGSLSYDEWLKLPLKEKQARISEVK